MKIITDLLFFLKKNLSLQIDSLLCRCHKLWNVLANKSVSTNASLFFILFLFTFHFSFFAPSRAQVARLYTLEHGLQSSYISSLYVDHSNMLWISTSLSLELFDGHRFHNINYTDPLTGKSLFNEAKSIRQIDDHHYMVMTNAGLFEYDISTNHFTRIKLSVDEAQIGYPITQMLDLPQKDLVIIPSDGLGIFVMNLKTRKPDSRMTLKINQIIGNTYVNEMLVDSKGIIWTNDINHRLIAIDGKKINEIELNIDAQAQQILARSYVMSFAEDLQENKIYMATSNDGVLVYERATNTVRELTNNQRSLYCMTLLITKDGRLILGTDNLGLWTINRQTEELEAYPVTSENFDTSYTKVHYLAEDNDGNLIAGLFQRGLLVVPRQTGGFHYAGPTTSKGRNSSCVTHFARTDNGDLWISTDGSGIYCVPYGQPGGTQNKNEGLNSLLVQTIAVDKRNTLWCGSWRGGLQCYENGRFITPSYLESYREMSFMSLAYDKKNDILYAGTNGIGVLRIDLTNKTVEPYARGDENQVLWVNELFIDNDGMLWINDAMSTFVHNPKTNKTKQITLIDNVVVSTANRIQIGNRILFGTDHGLFIYDKQQQKLVDDPLTEMLKDDKIKAFELSGDYLWFSSSCNKGLGCINLKTNKLIRFHSFDGFYIGEFHGGTSILLPDGNICFGGDNGIIYFDSHKILSLPQVIKPISFTSFRVGNQMVEFKENAENNILDASIFTASKAKLPMGENSFMISFSVPELTIPDRINYDYKLKGYEDDWHTTSAKEAQAYYASLPSGTYDFQVRAYFEDEPDEYSERTITIRVPAPWYASWWMTLIYLALAAAIGYYIYSVLHERRKARARLRESMQNERVKESKLRLFTSIAHELRSPLTMILSPLKQLQKEDTNPEHQENYQVMQRNCDRMLRVVNQITDVRKIDNGQFQLAFREVEYIRYANDMMASFSGLATAKNITFTSESEEKSVQVWLDPIHFEKVLTNLLSNAFKFTPTDGRILVRTTCHINGFDDNNRKVFDDPHILEYLETRIYNSGSHLDDSDINHLWERFYQGNKEQSAMGSGIGLNLCYELMRLHHGHISAHNVGTDGVEFIIRLPLGNAHLKKEEIATEPLIEKTEPATSVPETINQEEEEKLSEEKKAVEILTATEGSADTPEEDLKKTRYTVMVVDDDKELCLYVANGLRKDYNVYTANSGNEAWSLLLTHRPDVVVSDLIMPDGNGYELCRRIKENPDTDNIAVIILTSENNEDSQLQSITLQADHFLPKPFNLQLLRSALNQVLRVRETIRNKMRRTEIGHNYSAVSMDSAEEKFLKRVNDSIMSHIDDNEYGVQQLSEDVGISRVHLNRKLKEHFGISPNAFIRSIRLKHAAYLLVNNKANISEIAYKVGFSSHSYFSNNFHDYFGMTPKEFVAYYSNNLNDEALKKLLE